MADGRPDEKLGTNRAQQATDHESGGHGHSVAAWTAVGVILLGGLVAAIAVIVASWWLGIAGAVIILAGAVLGKVLSAMGFGPNVTIDAAAEDGGRGHDPAQGGVH